MVDVSSFSREKSLLFCLWSSFSSLPSLLSEPCFYTLTFCLPDALNSFLHEAKKPLGLGLEAPLRTSPSDIRPRGRGRGSDKWQLQWCMDMRGGARAQRLSHGNAETWPISGYNMDIKPGNLLVSTRVKDRKE